MEAHHPDVQKAADEANDFCRAWAKLKPYWPCLLVLQGNPGCGKTHIAKRVAGWASAVAFFVWSEAKHASSTIPTARFLDWGRICSPEKLDERGFLDLLSEIDGDSMTVIDDVGAEADRFKSGAHIERLCMILNRRAGKFTLLTTNHQHEEWTNVWDARVSDRLLRDSTIVTMKNPSFTTIV